MNVVRRCELSRNGSNPKYGAVGWVVARDGIARAVVVAVALCAFVLPAAAQDTSLRQALADVDGVFDVDEAMEIMRDIDPYFRDRGNDGYVRSIQRIFSELKDAGFSENADRGIDRLEQRDFGRSHQAWTPLRASLEVVEPDAGVLHAYDDESGLERTFVCVNSFPTKEGGVTLPLMRYDRSKPSDFYAGAVVLGTDPAEFLFERCVIAGGALGVISSYLGEYNRPDENRDAIRFARIPYNAERRGFALNVSPNKHDVLDRLLNSGAVWVKVNIDARFTEARSRTLIATIGGTDDMAGTVAVVGHIDEPGANDNGSGVATMTAMATGYLQAIREGKLPRPRRSVTFLWGTEFECSREWLRSRPGRVDLALVIDMVGQDLEKTGAIPLVERLPDPGAIWSRPPLDVHSEWGRGDVRESDLRGSYVNDYVMAAMNIRAEATNWPVRSNPFEGGSDHESFLERGIPSVLMWHFTDIYYHTNLDRLDKVDPASLESVGVTMLGLLHHFGSAGLQRADEVLDIVLAAARNRFAVEQENAMTFLGFDAVSEDPVQRDLVLRRERQIILAWSRWYREAMLSVVNYEPDPASPDRVALEERIDAALTELRGLQRDVLAAMSGDDEDAGNGNR